MAGDDGAVPFCENCGKLWFDMFSDCVLVLVYNEENEVALSSQWYLPEHLKSFTTGFMKPGETAEEAAAREVAEELGLAIRDIEYAGTYWFDHNSQLMHGYIGYAEKTDLVLSSEISSAKWVPHHEVPANMLPDFPGNAAVTVFRQFVSSRGLEMPDIPYMTAEERRRLLDGADVKNKPTE